MPNQSIVFSPELDERQLSKETKKVNQNLNESTKGIKPSFDSSGMDSLRPAGAGGGGGGMGAGGAVGMGALASKIPKPISGVAAASVMPIALAGGIGAGMLSAMHSSSARLQTSTNLLGTAWATFWRPIGNRLDELFIRDVAKDLLSTMQDFENRSQESGVIPAFGQTFGTGGGNVQFPLFPEGMMSTAGFVDALGFEGFAERMRKNQDALREQTTLTNNSVIPSLSDLDTAFSLVDESWQGWPDVSIPQQFWPSISADGVLVETFGDFSIGKVDLLDWVLGDGRGGGGDGGGGTPEYGSVTRNREGDPLSGTRATGGERNASSGGGESTSGGIEGVKREIQKLNSTMTNMGIEVDGETLGRVTDEAQRNRVAGNDPTVL